MELLSFSSTRFNYNSSVFSYFKEERDFGAIETTGEMAKNGQYIYRPKFYFYDPRNGAILSASLGIVYGVRNVFESEETKKIFHKDLEKVLIEAERTAKPMKYVIKYFMGDD